MSVPKPDTPAKPSIRARKLARRFAMQAVYQRQLNDLSAAEIERQFRDDNVMEKVDLDYFHELVHETIGRSAELIAEFEELLDRKITDIDPVEMAILQIGTYELCCRIDIPYRVVINEGIELAKAFGATDSHKYVNSILDRLARKHRAIEM